MGLEHASDVGTIDDVINMLQIQGVIFYFLIPFITCLLIIYIGHSINKRSNKNKKSNEKVKNDSSNKNIKETQVNSKSKPLGTTEEMLKKLDNIEEPLIKSDYRNLAINFDKNGRIIKENNPWQQKQYR